VTFFLSLFGLLCFIDLDELLLFCFSFFLPVDLDDFDSVDFVIE
jgi:hypothetical protein